MMCHRLIAHPKALPTRSLEVEGSVQRHSPAHLDLDFCVRGDLLRIIAPDRRSPTFRDELWRTTCFEAFIRLADETRDTGYVEINLSPSTEWAAYAFDDYRSGMRPLNQLPDPRIDTLEDGAILKLWARIDLSRISGFDSARPWEVGLSIILEEETGSKSYWALAHPPGKPDFHHRDCFALRIEAPADT